MAPFVGEAVPPSAEMPAPRRPLRGAHRRVRRRSVYDGLWSRLRETEALLQSIQTYGRGRLMSLRGASAPGGNDAPLGLCLDERKRNRTERKHEEKSPIEAYVEKSKVPEVTDWENEKERRDNDKEGEEPKIEEVDEEKLPIDTYADRSKVKEATDPKNVMKSEEGEKPKIEEVDEEKPLKLPIETYVEKSMVKGMTDPENQEERRENDKEGEKPKIEEVDEEKLPIEIYAGKSKMPEVTDSEHEEEKSDDNKEGEESKIEEVNEEKLPIETYAEKSKVKEMTDWENDEEKSDDKKEVTDSEKDEEKSDNKDGDEPKVVEKDGKKLPIEIAIYVGKSKDLENEPKIVEVDEEKVPMEIYAEKSTVEEVTDPENEEGQLELQALLMLTFNMLKTEKKCDNIKLYVRRVFITDDCEEFTPEWLSFVNGAVDLKDLPLNIPRKTLRRIKQNLVKKCMDLEKKGRQGAQSKEEEAGEEKEKEEMKHEKQRRNPPASRKSEKRRNKAKERKKEKETEEIAHSHEVGRNSGFGSIVDRLAMSGSRPHFVFFPGGRVPPTPPPKPTQRAGLNPFARVFHPSVPLAASAQGLWQAMEVESVPRRKWDERDEIRKRISLAKKAWKKEEKEQEAQREREKEEKKKEEEKKKKGEMKGKEEKENGKQTGKRSEHAEARSVTTKMNRLKSGTTTSTADWIPTKKRLLKR